MIADGTYLPFWGQGGDTSSSSFEFMDKGREVTWKFPDGGVGLQRSEERSRS